MFAAVTNWHTPEYDYADRISRGTGHSSPATRGYKIGEDWLLQFECNPYRPFNLLFGTPTQMLVAYGRDSISIDSVSPDSQCFRTDRLMT